MGESIALLYLVNKEQPKDLLLCLYKNDVKDGKFTEADFKGYKPIKLIGSKWSVSGSKKLLVKHEQHEFKSTADQWQAIWGYYLRLPDGEIVHAERFTNPPYEINLEGDVIRVVPAITCKGK